MSRRICVVTGTRADYGLLRWVMQGIAEAPDLRLQVVATGMHLAPEFGLTYREIEQDGFAIDAKVETQLASDTSTGLAKSVGLGVIGFAETFDRLDPHVVLVLGDRFEAFAAVQAAFYKGLCIAHVSGGEVTEGALDDALRHCITKMSRVHFVAAEPYRRRVIQLGEAPESVLNVGDPALDSIERMALLPRAELCGALGLDPSREFLLVTMHPETAGAADPARDAGALLEALDRFPAYGVLATKANADTGGRAINALVDGYAARHPGRVVARASLGRLNYLSAMKHCAAVVGNSSSGIVEAPAMRVPTVDVGDRQAGRLRASSILHCPADPARIASAIGRAVSVEFRRIAAQTVSLYGNRDASQRIVGHLRSMDVSRNAAKRFHDLAG